jgi:hypothetical protein
LTVNEDGSVLNWDTAIAIDDPDVVDSNWTGTHQICRQPQ